MDAEAGQIGQVTTMTTVGSSIYPTTTGGEFAQRFLSALGEAGD